MGGGGAVIGLYTVKITLINNQPKKTKRKTVAPMATMAKKLVILDQTGCSLMDSISFLSTV